MKLSANPDMCAISLPLRTDGVNRRVERPVRRWALSNLPPSREVERAQVLALMLEEHAGMQFAELEPLLDSLGVMVAQSAALSPAM